MRIRGRRYLHLLGRLLLGLTVQDQVPSSTTSLTVESLTANASFVTWQAWLVAAAVTGSFGSFDTLRFVGLPGYAGTATASTSLYSIGARLRAGYEVSFQDWYVRPYVDLDLIHTHSPSYNESGPAPSLTWIRPPSSPLPP
jgi:uncharacterized protein YhjY with autotransporter beta-barrel domain